MQAGSIDLWLNVGDEDTPILFLAIGVTVVANTEPTIGGLADIGLLAETTTTLTVTLGDADDDDDATRLKARAESNNEAIATASIAETGGATRVLTVSAGSMVGTATITVLVDDRRGVTNSVVSETFEVSVEANKAPILTIKSPMNQTIRPGSTASIIVSVADANFDMNDSIVLEAVSSPSSVVSVQPARIVGVADDTDRTFVLTAKKAGTATIRLTTTDSRGANVSKLVIVRVNTPPIVSQSITTQVATIGQIFNLKASHFFSDEDGDTLRYEASGLPDSITIGSTGTLVGVPIYGEESKSVNGRDVILSAFDGRGASTQTTFKLLIDAETTGTVSVNSDATWRLQATAEVGDANGISEINYQWYRSKVGVALPTKLTGETSRTYMIADDRVSRAAGTLYEISATIVDEINRRVVLSTRHTVVNEAPIIETITQGTVFEGDTIDVTASDANHDILRYMWDVVDEADGSAINVADNSLRFVVPPDLVKPPAEATTLTLKLTVSDGLADVSTMASVRVKRKDNGMAIPTVLIRDGPKLMPPTIDLSGDPDGAGTSATYVWQQCSSDCSTSDGSMSDGMGWTDIGVASSSATPYTIGAGQAGYRFRLKVRYIDGQGYENVIFYNSGMRIRSRVFLEGPLR